MIDALERDPSGGVQLRRSRRGPGWQVDAVDRSGCAGARRRPRTERRAPAA